MIYKLLLLIALIKLLLLTDRPVLCAGLYAICIGIMGFMGQALLANILIAAGIGFVASFIYFWLLNKFHSGIIWWLIAVPGLLVCLV